MELDYKSIFFLLSDLLFGIFELNVCSFFSSVVLNILNGKFSRINNHHSFWVWSVDAMIHILHAAQNTKIAPETHAFYIKLTLGVQLRMSHKTVECKRKVNGLELAVETWNSKVMRPRAKFLLESISWQTQWYDVQCSSWVLSNYYYLISTIF